MTDNIYLTHQPISNAGGLITTHNEEKTTMRHLPFLTGTHKSRPAKTVCTAFLLGLAAPFIQANSLETTTCFDQYLSDLETCNDFFNDQNNPNYHNAQAWGACRDGARNARSTCEDFGIDPLADDIWNEFLDNLKNCIDTFGENSDNPAANPENLQDCIEVALDTLRQQLENLLGDDACDDELIPQNIHNSVYVGKMTALELAAIETGATDGKYPVKVNTSMTVSAGINMTPGGQYDAGQIPCVKSAVAIAIYQTKSGTAVVPMDADMNTSDGTTFDILFFSDQLIDASEVTVLSVFFDDESRPMFAEKGIFTIQESPITGDWNRDEVLNTQDVTDFLDSYNAQTKRADINGDDQVTPEDVIEYINP